VESKVQPDSVIRLLRYLVTVVPAVCLAISVVPLWFYPIDRAMQSDIAEKLEEKKRLLTGGERQRSQVDPSPTSSSSTLMTTSSSLED